MCVYSSLNDGVLITASPLHELFRLNPADTEFHAICRNGGHTLADPHSKIHCIEEVFYERMFDNTGNPED